MKRIFLICLLLMFITIGAVGAADNQTDEPIELENEDAVCQDEVSEGSEISGEIVDHYGSYPISYRLYCPEDYTGNVTFSVNKTLYLNDKAVNEKEYFINATDLKEGEYSLLISYLGDDKHPSHSYEEIFDIVGLFEVPDDDFVIGDSIFINLPPSATGTISIYSGDVLIQKEPVSDADGIRDSITLYNLTFRTHNITFVYEGDKNFHPVSKSAKIRVVYTLTPSVINELGSADVVVGYENLVEIQAPEDIDWDKVSAAINGTVYRIRYDGEIHFINVTDLKFGEYVIVLNYEGDKKFKKLSVNETLSAVYVPYIPNSIYNLDDEYIFFKLPKAKGKFVVKLNGKEFARKSFTNSFVKVSLKNLAPGDYDVECSYEGTDYKFDEPWYESLYVEPIFIMPDPVVDVGSKTNVTVVVPSDVGGTLVVMYDDGDTRQIVAPIIDGTAVADLDLKMGSYHLDVFCLIDGMSYDESVDVNVVPKEFKCPEYVDYGQSADFYIELPKTAQGNITIFFNSEVKYNEKVINGIANVSFSDLAPGNYYVSIRYVGEDLGDFQYNTLITVGPKITCPETITAGDTAKMIFELQGVKGTLNVYINNSNFNKTVSFNSKYTLNLPKLGAGLWIIRGELATGDDTYKFEKHLLVRGNPDINVRMQDIFYGQDEIITVSMTNASGNITICINGVKYIKEFRDDKINLVLSDLKEGKYSVLVVYPGNNVYYALNKTTSFEVVRPADPEITVEISNPIFEGDEIEIYISINAKATGYVTVTFMGEFYDAEIIDGEAEFYIDEAEVGSFDIDVSYGGNKYVLAGNKKQTVTVLPIVEYDPSIAAKNVNVYYTQKATYTATVYYGEGVVMPGEDADICINDRFFKTLRTDSKGEVSFTLSKTPGNYKVYIYSSGVSLTTKITVKHLLTLKKVTVKKSAKKLVLQASLAKINGKYLKNKKITFKFNGKKYTSKTNSKGIAKVTIKKAVLKKLKVGKKITYHVTYLKDIVKKTVKVKK